MSPKNSDVSVTPRERIQSSNLDKSTPPGQAYVDTFPISDITPNLPLFDSTKWRFRVWGAVENPVEWAWDELMQLSVIEVVADFHCVTKWSKKALV